jgi:hypothetical protein
MSSSSAPARAVTSRPFERRTSASGRQSSLPTKALLDAGISHLAGATETIAGLVLRAKLNEAGTAGLIRYWRRTGVQGAPAAGELLISADMVFALGRVHAGTKTM